jgi:D-aminopeptidase
MSPLFQAAIEATEEAIYNSLCMAETMMGYRNTIIRQLPLDKLAELIRNHL